jgi:hypothetical protein
VRRFRSDDKPEEIDEKTQAYPTYWFRPPRVLSAKAGMQRWIWDLNYAPPEDVRRSYPMTAIYQNTPPEPSGPTVIPGDYTVKLTVNGKSYTQPLTIKMDPRVQTPPAGIQKMFEISYGSYEAMQKSREALNQIRALRRQIEDLKKRAGQGGVSDGLTTLDKKVASLEGQGGGGGFGAPAAGEPTFNRLNGQFLSLMNLVEGADVMPTTQAQSAYTDSQKALSDLLARWREVKEREVNAVNAQLRAANLPAITL